ncbi:mediator of DNA damage checkpoint protein 1-like isoform X2 [Corticium candelabrum]|uniref:mediator of DNA damage checkpoint protein 1-like isoform X2 n=1 Tax=Corticium candelabrum TaxID=121492 RepID=UPI002E25B3F0|nr:mediator of DNA damage checkpoint protein 1-like isoform X2 [Corticium candelabrum]
MGDETQPLEYDDSTDDETTNQRKRPVAYVKVLKQKGVAEKTCLVFEGENVVGRDVSCNVHIPVKALSKQHACIETSHDVHFIKDLNSKNKTHRGDMPLRPQVCYELTSGSCLTFAGIKCEYHIGDAPEMNNSGDETTSEIADDVTDKVEPHSTSTTGDLPSTVSTHNMLTSQSLISNTSQQANETLPFSNTGEAPDKSKVLASDTPPEGKNHEQNNESCEMERTVISASDDDVATYGSPSVICEGNEEIGGSGQTIEPTLLLTESCSDGVDVDTISERAENAENSDTKATEREEEEEEEYMFDSPTLSPHINKDTSNETTLISKRIDDESKTKDNLLDNKHEPTNEEINDYDVEDVIGGDMEQTQAYFIMETFPNSGTATTATGSPSPNVEQTLPYNLVGSDDEQTKDTDECEPTLAYDLQPESEANSEEACEPTLAYNLEEDANGDDLGVNESGVEMEGNRKEDETKSVCSDEAVGGKFLLTREASDSRESGVASVDNKSKHSEESVRSQGMSTRTRRKSKAPKRVAFMCDTSEQPGDDDSNHTSTASIESRDLGDSQTTKSGRPLLSLRKVQLGSFGFSHSEPAAAVGVAMDDFEMSCDSPVNVCSRTKKARVLDSDDSFSWTNEKKKEEKADGEVDDAEGSSQSLTGTGQNSIRKAGKRATRGGGRGHRKNLKQSIGESNDATAAATVALGDVGTESLSSAAAVCAVASLSADKTFEAASNRTQHHSQQQSTITSSPKTESEAESLSSTPIVAADTDSQTSVAVGKMRRKRGLSDVTGNSEALTAPPPLKRRRSSLRQSVAGSADVIESGPPKVLFTGMRYKQGEKIVGDLGGIVVSSVHDCTHLIADKVLKTVKFLCVLARGKLIVATQWLDACKRAKTFVDASSYIIHDTASEKEHKFKLKTSIANAAKKPLFKDYKIYVTKSVKPPYDAMRDIVCCAGGEMLAKLPEAYEEQTVIISCAEDLHLCRRSIEKGIPVHSKDFVVEGVLKQEILTSTKLIVDCNTW